MFAVSLNVEPKSDGYIGYKSIDLSGIQQIALSATANPSQGFAGGIVEVHMDKPDGELLGQAEVKPVNPFAALMSAANATQNNGGGKSGGAKSAAKPAGPPKAGAAKAKRKGFDMGSLAKLMAGMATKIDIKDQTGKHDVYFVFKNTAAKPAQPLMSVSNIELRDVKAAAIPGSK